MKILLPTDFSDCANNALVYAIDLAKEINVELILFHAYHYEVEPINDTMIDITDLIKVEASKKINALHANEPLINKRIISYGLANDEILALIDSENIDLVIMGTSGASNITDKLLGTVTSNLIRKINIPLLAIPKKAIYHKNGDVLAAIDFNDTHIPNLSPLKNITKNDQEVRVFYANNSSKEIDFTVGIKNIKEQLNGLNLAFSLTHDKDALSAIEQKAKDLHSKLIVTYNKHYSFIKSLFHKSVSESIIKRSDTPVLILKESIASN